MPSTTTPTTTDEAPADEVTYAPKGEAAAALTATYASQRVEGESNYASAVADYSGNSTHEDRKARNMLALTTAGLFAGTFTPTAAPAPNRLTPQRLTVLADLFDGYSYTEMAARQHRNVETVKKHCANLYGLFGVHSRVECVVEAVRAGVLPALPAPGSPAPRPSRARRARTTAVAD